MRAWLAKSFLLVAALLLAQTVAYGAETQPAAGEFFAQAIGNDNISYTATRTSLFWSDTGKTRALITRVYKDGSRVLYEYPARGNRPPHKIIETAQDIYFIRPEHNEITFAPRQRDADVDGVRVKMALANYRWEYEHSSPARVIVAAYHPGATRPSDRFWIATATKIVVRAERYGAQGELRSSWALDQVHTVDKGKLPDKLFEPTLGPSMVMREISLPVRVSPASMESHAGFVPKLLPPGVIPSGYQLVDVFLEVAKDYNSVRLVYSDGLDSFSLLEAPRKPNKSVTISAARRVQILDTTAQVVTSAEANIVHWQDEARYYTLIGSQGEGQVLALSRAMIAASQPPTPAVAPHRSIGQVLQHGWVRFLRILGI